LDELERLLSESGIGSPDEIRRAKSASKGLGRFARSLVGLESDAAKAALAGFLAGKTATANQIEFLNLIVNHLTEHGLIETARLYESPFTDLTPQGPDSLFIRNNSTSWSLYLRGLTRLLLRCENPSVFFKNVKLIVLALIVCNAQLAGAADKWLSVRSRNFLLVGNASESQIRKVGRNFEEFRAAMATLFPGIGQDSTIGTTVVVFRNDVSFRPFKPLYEGKPANIGGIFIGDSDLNSIALTVDRPSTDVIYHEFVHSLTKQSGTPMPPWVSEGIAELYSTFEIASNGKHLTLGKPVNTHIITLRQNQFLPFPTLFAVERDSPQYNEKSKQGIFYAQSWATIHYLLLGNEGKRRPQFSNYLKLLAGGKSREDSFREAFQMDYATLEKELDAYVRNRFSIPGVIFDLYSKLDFDREMQTTPLSEAGVAYYLGDLLLHMNRLDVAEAQLQKSISLDPSSAPSYASLGLLRLRQDRDDDALKYLTQAVESDSQNHMAHYYYAYMLQKFSAGEVRAERESRLRLMRTHLKKSLELAPRYVEAYRLLGYVAAALEEEMDETEELLRRAVTFAPGRQDLQLSLFQLMVFNNKAQAARFLVAQLINVAEDEVVRKQAEGVMQSIMDRLQYENEVRAYNERRAAYESTRPVTRVEEKASEKTSEETPAIRRNPASTSSDSRTETIDRLTASRPVGSEIEGKLTSIDCARGATFRLQVGGGFMELHSDKPAEIEFKSYVSTITASISCGPLKTPVSVRIVYRRISDGRFIGEPLLIEFIEK